MKRLTTITIPLIVAGCLFGPSADAPLIVGQNNTNNSNNEMCECPEDALENADGWVCDAGECVADCAQGFRLEEGGSCSDENCESEDPFGDYLDQDCDGSDGVVEDTVYVSTQARPNGTGLTPDSPIGSIRNALSVAYGGGRSNILIAGGDYYSTLDITGDISITGGYLESFSGESEVVTQIIPDSPSTTIAVESSVVAQFQGFAAYAWNFEMEPGAGALAAITLYAGTGSQLEFRGVLLVGGVGRPGPNGMHGLNSAPGSPGSPGQDAVGGNEGAGSDVINNGGKGNSGLSCTGPVRSAESGQPMGGAGGVDSCYPLSASNGGDGPAGDNGVNSALWPNDEFGDFDGGLWLTPQIVFPAATDGGIGQGGGGGGAVSNDALGDRHGGGGGGGGGGAGKIGEIGKIGTPSVVLILDVGAKISSQGSGIVLGRGGRGGNGGNGSCGGPGGQGGAGFQVQATSAGNGGRGGRGGHAGHGAGGPGAPTFGVVVLGDGDHGEPNSFMFIGQEDPAPGGLGGSRNCEGENVAKAPNGEPGLVEFLYEQR